MAKEWPRILAYMVITLFFDNLIPVLGILFPDSIAYYTRLLDIWIIVPIYSLVIGIIVSSIHDMNAYLPVLIGICYIPTVMIFYDGTMVPFIIAYVIINFIGNLIGSHIFQQRIKEEY